MSGITWEQEIFNAGLSVLVAMITLSFGWLVGQRLTVSWAIRQKRRELELTAASEFYKLYGEFFAIYKLWSYASRPNYQLDSPETTRWDLLKQASFNEGALESLFVKLSSERTLSDIEIEILGKFRQAFQSLRESIRDNENVGWFYHAHPEYLSFKRLAYLTACIINSDSKQRDEVEPKAADALERITANIWDNWVLSNADWERLVQHFQK